MPSRPVLIGRGLALQIFNQHHTKNNICCCRVRVHYTSFHTTHPTGGSSRAGTGFGRGVDIELRRP